MSEHIAMPTKKCYIFESCNQLFPDLESGLLSSKEKGYTYKMVAKSQDESDLTLINIEKESLKGQFRVRLFSEFELNGIIRQHPNFIISLDFRRKRAEVLSFESNLYPHIRLDAYTVIDSVKYTNIVALKDLKTLFLTWMKQLNELNYKSQWEEKVRTA